MVTAEVDVRDADGPGRRPWPTGVDRLGRLDIAVANAGVCTVQRWDEVTPEVWDTVIGINLTGAWNTCVAAIPHLLEAGGGSLILISSVGRPQGPALPRSLRRLQARGGRDHAQRWPTSWPPGTSGSTRSTPPGSTPPCWSAGGLTERIEASPDIGSIFLNSLPVDLVAARGRQRRRAVSWPPTSPGT